MRTRTPIVGALLFTVACPLPEAPEWGGGEPEPLDTAIEADADTDADADADADADCTSIVWSNGQTMQAELVDSYPSDWTIETWFRPDLVLSEKGYGGILGLPDLEVCSGFPSQWHLIAWNEGTSDPGAGTINTGPWSDFATSPNTSTWALGDWLHIALQRSGDGAGSLYVDGDLAQTYASLPPPNPACELYFGNRQGSASNKLDGAMASLKFSSIVRYATNFTPTTQLFDDPDTVWLYDFAEGAGSETFTTDGNSSFSIGSTGWETAGPSCQPPTSDIGSSANNPGFSCLTILSEGGDNGDGTYWIDPDGDGTATEVYCDMTTDGGGWTLLTVNGMDGRPGNWTENSYPRPGAAAYGSLVTAVTDVAAIQTGATSASNYSINATALFPASAREVMIHLGGATRDYITATLPSTCNFFDGSTWCEEDAHGFFSVYRSDGNILSANAQACTTAHNAGADAQDTFNEFGLHLLEGYENTPGQHCNTGSSQADQNHQGRIYTTLESDEPTNHWSDGALSHWNTPDISGRIPTPAYLLLR